MQYFFTNLFKVIPPKHAQYFIICMLFNIFSLLCGCWGPFLFAGSFLILYISFCFDMIKFVKDFVIFELSAIVNIDCDWPDTVVYVHL